jgi:hypothetical protein
VYGTAWVDLLSTRTGVDPAPVVVVGTHCQASWVRKDEGGSSCHLDDIRGALYSSLPPGQDQVK